MHQDWMHRDIQTSTDPVTRARPSIAEVIEDALEWWPGAEHTVKGRALS
jgi:hypothetical protein